MNGHGMVVVMYITIYIERSYFSLFKIDFTKSLKAQDEIILRGMTQEVTGTIHKVPPRSCMLNLFMSLRVDLIHS